MWGPGPAACLPVALFACQPAGPGETRRQQDPSKSPSSSQDPHSTHDSCSGVPGGGGAPGSPTPLLSAQFPREGALVLSDVRCQVQVQPPLGNCHPREDQRTPGKMCCFDTHMSFLRRKSKAVIRFSEMLRTCLHDAGSLWKDGSAHRHGRTSVNPGGSKS